MKRFVIIFLLTIAASFMIADIYAGPRDVVVVVSEDIGPFREIADAFSWALKEQRHDLSIEQYYLSSDSTALEKIKTRQPYLIFTIGTYATETVIEENLSPRIVFAGISEPQESEIIKQSKAAGVTLDVPVALQLDYLKHVIPALKSVGVIYHPKENETVVQKIKKIADSKEITLRIFPVNSPADVNRLGRMDVDVLLLIPDSIVCQPKTAKTIIVKSVKDNVLSVGMSAAYAQAGTCFAIASDYAEVGLQSAELVLKILDGDDPSRLGIVAPRRVNYFLNKTVAERLKIDIPVEIEKGFKEVFGK